MEELYRQYSQIVFHFLYKRCNDPALAEDLMQETFLKALERLDSYDHSCKLSTWLCQIAKHLYYQHLAKNGREIPMQPHEDLPSNRPLPENTVLNRLELLHVLKEMQKLPSQMREVIYLRTTADLSFREIGEILGQSENWARVNFYRGKKLLADATQTAKKEEPI